MPRTTKIDLNTARQNYESIMHDLLFSMLPLPKRNRIIRAGLVACARVANRSAKQRIRSRTGNLRAGVKSIYRPFGQHRLALGEAQLRVDPPGYHWHLVEYGHAIVTRDGRVVGQVKPYPFIRPAVTTTTGQQLTKAAAAMRAQFIKAGGNPVAFR